MYATWRDAVVVFCPVKTVYGIWILLENAREVTGQIDKFWYQIFIFRFVSSCRVYCIALLIRCKCFPHLICNEWWWCNISENWLPLESSGFFSVKICLKYFLALLRIRKFIGYCNVRICKFRMLLHAIAKKENRESLRIFVYFTKLLQFLGVKSACRPRIMAVAGENSNYFNPPPPPVKGTVKLRANRKASIEVL